jgi:hypothetical protein
MVELHAKRLIRLVKKYEAMYKSLKEEALANRPQNAHDHNVIVLSDSDSDDEDQYGPAGDLDELVDDQCIEQSRYFHPTRGGGGANFAPPPKNASFTALQSQRKSFYPSITPLCTPHANFLKSKQPNLCPSLVNHLLGKVGLEMTVLAQEETGRVGLKDLEDTGKPAGV